MEFNSGEPSHVHLKITLDLAAPAITRVTSGRPKPMLDHSGNTVLT